MKIINSVIPSLVMEECCEKILIGASKGVKSARQLSDEYNIPISLCYNRIRLLEKMGILRRVGTRLNRKGVEIGLYKSNLKRAAIFYQGGRIKLRFELASGLTKEFEKEVKSDR